MDGLPESQFIMLLALLVPGFISMKTYGALHPVEETSLKDNVLEAVAFGVVNFALLFWPILLISDVDFISLHPLLAYFMILLIFLIAPIIWPIILIILFRVLERRNFILRRYKTAWDDFFIRRQPCWVIIHLKDGRRVGGRYAERSYASLYPNSGHLYLEELWRLDETGRFVEKVPGSAGLIVRPSDYELVELFLASGEADGPNQR